MGRAWRASRPRSRASVREAGCCQAGPAAGGNPQIPKGGRRRPRAGVHRGDARLEERRRAQPRPRHRRTVPDVRKAVKWNSPLLRRRGSGLVPQLPLLHEVREGGVLPRSVAASAPRASPSRRRRATWTSTRTTRSMTLSSSRGWSRPASCRVKPSDADRRSSSTRCADDHPRSQVQPWRDAAERAGAEPGDARPGSCCCGGSASTWPMPCARWWRCRRRNRRRRTWRCGIASMGSTARRSTRPSSPGRW